MRSNALREVARRLAPSICTLISLPDCRSKSKGLCLRNGLPARTRYATSPRSGRPIIAASADLIVKPPAILAIVTRLPPLEAPDPAPPPLLPPMDARRRIEHRGAGGLEREAAGNPGDRPAAAAARSSRSRAVAADAADGCADRNACRRRFVRRLAGHLDRKEIGEEVAHASHRRAGEKRSEEGRAVFHEAKRERAVVVVRADLVGALGPVGMCRVLGIAEEGGEIVVVDDDQRARRLVAADADVGDGDPAADEVMLGFAQRVIVLEENVEP